MAEYHWNKLKQRLANITAKGLDISFNNSPVRKKTYRNEIIIRFFQIKLDGEVIWRFPKDSKQPIDKGFICGILYEASELNNWEEWILVEFPIQSIIKYLDLPKDQLIYYEDKVGLAEILKVCDKRIGYNRLRNLNLSPAAKKIFKARFNKHLL